MQINNKTDTTIVGDTTKSYRKLF